MYKLLKTTETVVWRQEAELISRSRLTWHKDHLNIKIFLREFANEQTVLIRPLYWDAIEWRQSKKHMCFRQVSSQPMGRRSWKGVRIAVTWLRGKHIISCLDYKPYKPWGTPNSGLSDLRGRFNLINWLCCLIREPYFYNQCMRNKENYNYLMCDFKVRTISYK